MALHVRLLGIPVRIHAWFALTGLIIWNFSGGAQFGWGTLPIALLIVFQGVLFHELGHALMGRRFGLEPQIDLAFFAGLTRWTGGRSLTPGRGVLVSFAGPLVGIVLGSLGLSLWTALPAASKQVQWTMAMFVYVNLGWSLLNLVPILPLDGGNILAHFLQMISPRGGVRWARYISVGLVAALAGLLLMFTVADQARYEQERNDADREALVDADEAEVEQPFNPLFFLIFLGFFGFSNVQALRAERAFRKSGLADATTPEDLLAIGADAIERKDAETASQAAFILLRIAQDPTQRDDALHLLAWARLLADRPDQAHEALRRFSGERDPDPALEGAVALDLGEARRASELLRRALPDPFAANRFVRAVRESGELSMLDGLAPDALAPAQWEQLHELALELGDYDIAFMTAAVLFEREPDGRVAFDAVVALTHGGRLEDAWTWLERARQAGFRDTHLLDEHEALAPLRELPEWTPLRARFD